MLSIPRRSSSTFTSPRRASASVRTSQSSSVCSRRSIGSSVGRRLGRGFHARLDRSYRPCPARPPPAAASEIHLASASPAAQTQKNGTCSPPAPNTGQGRGLVASCANHAYAQAHWRGHSSWQTTRPARGSGAERHIAKATTVDGSSSVGRSSARDRQESGPVVALASIGAVAAVLERDGGAQSRDRAHAIH